jgi:glycine/D-amino acid oxidase-like deaminating enzyme/nitrite reductase/ring-hydroxylating ferredoxin subunit
MSFANLKSSSFFQIYKHLLNSNQNNHSPMEVERTAEETSGARSTHWIDTAPHRLPLSPLNSDITVDTCVIGAGISGLSTAYFLSKQGQKVAVLDDGYICSGETGRTTGYLTWVIDDGLTNIINFFGNEGAILHVNSHRTAVDIVERIVRDENINCEFKRVPGYWFSRKPKGEQNGHPDKEISEELEAMHKVGMTEASIVDRPPYHVDDGKCIQIPNQGQFHSVAYCYGLAQSIINNGSNVYINSKASDYNKDNKKKPWVKTEAGYTVNCDKIVMATNVPLQFLTTISKMEPHRTYVVAGEVPKGKYEWCIFQDDSMRHNKPYKYGRFTSLNETADLLLVGGEDHKVGFKTDFEERYQALEKWASERYPDIKFTYRWSGQVEEPADHIAFIGLDPGFKDVYIITGDSGLGLTHGTLGGKLVSDLILGIPNPWKDLYDPSRFKLKSAPELVKHLCEIQTKYSDYFKGSDVPDIEDIIPGEGAIICKGIQHYAVYKDEGGKCHATSAVCPHLKGLVRWNNSEKSWDCPVHGSRFDKLGKPINGPAKTNLSEVNIEELVNKQKK